MLGNKNTQDRKSIQAIKLSNAEMEKVSGGVDYSNYGGFELTNGGIRGYGNSDEYGGYGGYESGMSGMRGYGDYVVPGSS